MIDALALLPENSPKRFDSRHRLVLASSQRAKHLMQGAQPVGPSKFTKETTIALEEVLHGRIEFLMGKEARQAMKEAKRSKEGEVERMSVLESEEDVQAIKKDLSVYVDDSSAKSTENDSEE
jgi:DNA-directed RNA polymerase subunit omega